jgi:hypothetical protein
MRLAIVAGQIQVKLTEALAELAILRATGKTEAAERLQAEIAGKYEVEDDSGKMHEPHLKPKRKTRLCPVRTSDGGMRYWHKGRQRTDKPHLQSHSFAAQRKDQRYCSKACQQKAARNRRMRTQREAERAANIERLGGKCSQCGTAEGKLYVYETELLCGVHRSERNRQTFHRERWPKGTPGYNVVRIRIFNLLHDVKGMTFDDAVAYATPIFARSPPIALRHAIKLLERRRDNPDEVTVDDDEEADIDTDADTLDG